MMKSSSVKSINEFGQRIWLDYFDRKLIDSGELERLIEEGIGGVTSNPAIFEKAITNSSDYDEDIRAFFEQGSNSEDVFFQIAIKDIQWAADLFRPLYEKTKGEDGYVSIEVSPRFAYDADRTIEQARKLWTAINRKNVMIKIPATTEGIAAIRQSTSEGINVNITLLFGLSRYKEVIGAYLAGLEDRVKMGLPIFQITSVASFFLSRIDVLLEPVLMKKGLNYLNGEVAIASAKKAYSMYQELFNNPRFKALEIIGAKRQRLLWASTSSKNPAFSDVKYVEALIGPETINTIPLETLHAFNDHGKVGSHLGDDLDHANSVLSELNNKGIMMDEIAGKLEKEGIDKFNRALDQLMVVIDQRKLHVHA